MNQPATPIETTAAAKQYCLTPQLPIDFRQMETAWRDLLGPHRKRSGTDQVAAGAAAEPLAAQSSQQPGAQQSDQGRVPLLVLVDCQGSMAPFTLVVSALTESILSAGLRSEVGLHYFHDIPEGVLYQHPSLSEARALGDVLAEGAGGRILILSDAGAARGYFDRERLDDTQAFLTKVGEFTSRHAWLNPVPASRWRGTTAEEIARLTPMFPMDHEGMDSTVACLRGRVLP